MSVVSHLEMLHHGLQHNPRSSVQTSLRIFKCPIISAHILSKDEDEKPVKRKRIPSLTLTALQQARHPHNPTPRHSGV